jgi:uncharacterized protein
MEALFDFLTWATFGYDESHDASHGMTVMELARQLLLSESEEYRRTHGILIEIAALLHDTVDHKYPNAAEKREKLMELLQRHYPVIAEDVLTIIDTVSYSKEKKNGLPEYRTPELRRARDIVSDADKLESYSIKRCGQYTRGVHPEWTWAQLQDAMVEHYHEKLEGLSAYIYTPAGKELAKRRKIEMDAELAWMKEQKEWPEGW